MSTKCTISYDDEYHLYEECFEKDNVHLQLDNVGAVDISASPGSLHATIQIPIKTWRKIVAGWIESQWAEHPEWDNKHPFDDYDGEALIRFLEEKTQEE